MKQVQLIRATSKKIVYSIWELNIVFDAFIETVKQTLESGETVTLKSFGTFEVKPLGDSDLNVPPRREVVFTCEAFDVNK